jgi:hypothetical protein
MSGIAVFVITSDMGGDGGEKIPVRVVLDVLIPLDGLRSLCHKERKLVLEGGKPYCL